MILSHVILLRGFVCLLSKKSEQVGELKIFGEE